MKPKFTTLLCLCFLCGVFHTARAEDSYRSVIVTTASDEIIKFDLSGGVDVVFSDTDMIITATSNQVTLPLTDFARFDYIVGMDADNLRALQRIAATAPEVRATLLPMADFLRGYEAEKIPDPYYGTGRDFDYVLDLLEDASPALLDFVLGKA